jgi:hypothetical protein
MGRDGYDEWAFDEREHHRGSEPDRVTHLVFVDGRLAETWTEPVEGSRWEALTERWSAPRRPDPPPRPPQHVQVLEWLDGACGGRAAVLALDEERLVDDGTDLPDAGDRATQQRLAETWAALERVTARGLAGEDAVALRRALVRTWERDPWAVTSPPSAEHLAGGLLWAVGKANLLLHPASPLTQRDLGEQIGLRGPLSSSGHLVVHALGGRVHHWSEPFGVPRLLPLGHADLLVSGVRRRLVQLRDQALSDAEAGAA